MKKKWGVYVPWFCGTKSSVIVNRFVPHTFYRLRPNDPSVLCRCSKSYCAEVRGCHRFAQDISTAIGHQQLNMVRIDGSTPCV